MKLGDKIIVPHCRPARRGRDSTGQQERQEPGRGLPARPAAALAIDRRTFELQLLLLKQDDGTWIEIVGNRSVTIEEVPS